MDATPNVKLNKNNGGVSLDCAVKSASVLQRSIAIVPIAVDVSVEWVMG